MLERLAKKYLARRGYLVTKGGTVTTFYGAGEWNKPAGVSYVRVESVGGGGGGGGSGRIEPYIKPKPSH